MQHMKYFFAIHKIFVYPHQPGGEGGEHEELLPGVGLQHEVVSGEGPHPQLRHELNVVVEQLELVEQVLHHQEWEEHVAGPLQVRLHGHHAGVR